MEIRKQENGIFNSVLIVDPFRYGHFPHALTRFHTYLAESISDLEQNVVSALSLCLS